LSQDPHAGSRGLRRFQRRLGFGLLQGLHHDRIEHQLPGIEFLRTSAIDKPEQLINLMVKHFQGKPGGMKLLIELFNLSIFLFDDRRASSKEAIMGTIFKQK
jgi:hypothetical protein